MIDTTPQKIATEPPPRATFGGPQAAFGLAFLLFSGYVIHAIVAKIRAASPGSSLHRDLFLPLAFLAIFPLIGLLFLIPGITILLRRARIRRGAAAHPGEPWFADYPWRPEGYRERVVAWQLGYTGPLVVIVAMLLPFHLWAWQGAPRTLSALLALFDLVLALLVGWLLLRIARKLRYGAVFVRYEHFPFFLGETLRVRVGTRRPLPPGVPLTATLRLVEERFPNILDVNYLDRYQIWAESITVAFDGASPDVEVRFELPATARATDLSSGCRHWWELHLYAKRPGVDFEETVVVPVYGRGR